MSRTIFCFGVFLLVANLSLAAEWGMKTGDPNLQSAGPLAFGSDGILFVGDTKAAAVVAIDTRDTDGDPEEVELHITGIDKSIAKAISADEVTINDFAVNPESGTGYVSVADGQGRPAIVKLLPNGDLERLSTTSIDYSKVVLPNAPKDEVVGEGRRRRNYRDESITDLAFSDGKVLVSGVAGVREANVRELVFPFSEADKGVNIEIYHGAHGRYENTASVKTFVPFKINGEPHLLAGFQCTPLVKFPVSEFKGHDQVRGTTLAELGNRNRPLDMIVYTRAGQDYLLLSNTARGVMKISTEDVERSEGITERIGGTAGQSYETIEGLKGVEQMDLLNSGHVIVFARNDDGGLDLHTVDLP